MVSKQERWLRIASSGRVVSFGLVGGKPLRPYHITPLAWCEGRDARSNNVIVLERYFRGCNRFSGGYVRIASAVNECGFFVHCYCRSSFLRSDYPLPLLTPIGCLRLRKVL